MSTIKVKEDDLLDLIFTSACHEEGICKDYCFANELTSEQFNDLVLTASNIGLSIGYNLIKGAEKFSKWSGCKGNNMKRYKVPMYRTNEYEYVGYVEDEAEDKESAIEKIK